MTARFRVRVEYVFDYEIDAEDEDDARRLFDEGDVEDGKVIDVYDGPIVHAVWRADR